MKQRLFLVFCSFLFTSCSMGKDSRDQNTAQLRQNKEVQDLYGGLVGTYNGKLLHTDHGDEDVQLIIYIDSQTVTNPDGTPGSKDFPVGYLRRSSPVIADYGLELSGLMRESGDFLMRNAGNESDVRTIQAHVSGRRITGVVNKLGGKLGDLDVTWTTDDTGSHNDLKDRLLRQYQAVEGEYIGRLQTNDPVKKKYRISITLSAVVVGATPQLIGYYRRLDVDSGVIDLPLTVSYRPDMSPPQITLNGRGGGKYQLDMDGTLIRDTMQVHINSLYEGYIGLAVLKR